MAENQITEWKAKWDDDYLAWICGFANAQGGKLYIGIDDNGNVTGLQNSRKLMEDLPNKIRDAMGIIIGITLHGSNENEYPGLITPTLRTCSILPVLSKVGGAA